MIKTTLSAQFSRRRAAKILGIAAAWLLSILGLCDASAAEPKASASTRQQPTAVQMESWRKTILKTPKAKTGCFNATYPDKEWHAVPCGTPPHKLYPPRHGTQSGFEQVGNGFNDFSPAVTGHITQAEGSFDSVVGVTSECAVACTPPNFVCPTTPTCAAGAANTYSLQLNSKPFTTSTCAGNAGCQGWEQFVYEGSSVNNGNTFIQYWLLDFGPGTAQCPLPRHAGCAANSSYNDGWCPLVVGTPPNTQLDCVVNAQQAATTGPVAITSLGTLKLTGAAAGVLNTNDEIVVTVGSSVSQAPGNNYFPDLGSQWQEVEFNVFGDGNGDQAVFNSGATVSVRTAVTSGTNLGPGCDLKSWTGESNNLTLGSTSPAPVKGTAPALLFSESSTAPTTAASCAPGQGATSVGDTHLTTVGGLYYDFQASGDFTLAQTGKGFIVQTRQVSGAPTWPNATVNKAVATQMAETRVALCTVPSRLTVDGKSTAVEDGKTLALPSGVNILHKGNVYLIGDQSGNSVRAEDNGTYINVSVGLGHWPQSVHGILANANGRVNEVEARTGKVLTAPFAMEDLYHEYADSWRVPQAESLLSACSDREIERGIPSKPFYANNLDPQVYKRARGACTAAGVKVKALLDACTLDVAVIGDASAAKVFVGVRAPIALGQVVVSRRGHGGDRDEHDKDHKGDDDRH